MVVLPQKYEVDCTPQKMVVVPQKYEVDCTPKNGGATPKTWSGCDPPTWMVYDTFSFLNISLDHFRLIE
jgi:hypothetical protein